MPKSRVVGAAWLNGASVVQMLIDYQDHAPNETGGVLMGYWATPDEVVITDVTSAGAGARHRPDAYEPDVAHDQREIARIYGASGRLHTYLGDWHTHPEAGPGLSRRDRRTLGAIGLDAAARVHSPLMLILGWNDEALLVGVWNLSAGRVRVRALRIRTFAAP